ncbi:MAG: dihydroorotate dehydrogenase, partial [Candidatus Marinamargulisbacteria bacterium]
TESPDVLLEIVTYMRSKTMAVIGIKLSPDDPNDKLLKLASVAVETEKVYINIGNTTYRTCEQVGLEKEAVSVGGGGFSGPALFERTLEMVQLLEPLKIPIIATGGVTTSEDVKVLLSQGATLVGLASAIMRDIYCIPKINRALSRRT